MTTDWLICDEFLCHVITLWSAESRQYTTLWTLCEDFTTTFNAFQSRHLTAWWLLCSEFLVTIDNFVTTEKSSLDDLLTILWRYSIKSDNFASVIESFYDDLETTLGQVSVKGQRYNNSKTTLQIIIGRPFDHTVTCDYTITTQNIENIRKSIWQICSHWWHRNLPLRQLTVPPVMTMLSNWQYFAFSENVAKQLYGYMSCFHVHTWSQ